MKIKFSFLFALAVLPLVVSCIGEGEDTPDQINYKESIQLKIGNYWVYDSKSLIINTDTVIQNPDDSTFIESDIILRNNVFAVVRNNYGLYLLQRDSLGYIIDETNRIFFSSDNFRDTLYKNPPEIGIMDRTEELVQVPAGKFKAVAFLHLTKEDAHHHGNVGEDPTLYSKDHRFRILSKTWYVRNIGVVKSVFYFGNSIAYEKNLKRYNVK